MFTYEQSVLFLNSKLRRFHLSDLREMYNSEDGFSSPMSYAQYLADILYIWAKMNMRYNN